MKPRTIKLNGPRNRWIIYVGFLGKWGDHLRIVRLNKRLRDVTGGWTLIKGPRPARNQDRDPAKRPSESDPQLAHDYRMGMTPDE